MDITIASSAVGNCFGMGDEFCWNGYIPVILNANRVMRYLVHSGCSSHAQVGGTIGPVVYSAENAELRDWKFSELRNALLVIEHEPSSSSVH